MKSMKNPPDGVKLVMEVICVILGKITDKEISLNKDNTWNLTKKLLNDTRLIEIIQNFDKVIKYSSSLIL
jgi:dynein heavy chain